MTHHVHIAMNAANFRTDVEAATVEDAIMTVRTAIASNLPLIGQFNYFGVPSMGTVTADISLPNVQAIFIKS